MSRKTKGYWKSRKSQIKIAFVTLNASMWTWLFEFINQERMQYSRIKTTVLRLGSVCSLNAIELCCTAGLRINFRRINYVPGSLTNYDLTFCFRDWVVTNLDSFPFDRIFCSPDQNLLLLKGINLNFRQQTTIKYTNYVFLKSDLNLHNHALQKKYLYLMTGNQWYRPFCTFELPLKQIPHFSSSGER